MNATASHQTAPKTEAAIILIADRNPRIREFLRRELVGAGHQVLLAAKGGDVLSVFKSGNRPDLVIMDPDLPDADEISPLAILKRCCRDLPVILHAYYPDEFSLQGEFTVAAQVEKRGNSVETLTRIINEIISRQVGQ